MEGVDIKLSFTKTGFFISKEGVEYYVFFKNIDSIHYGYDRIIIKHRKELQINFYDPDEKNDFYKKLITMWKEFYE